MTLGLALYPWPFPEPALALVKRAKAEMDLDYQVVPIKAVVGYTGRVLALREPPPFLCDCAVVLDPNSYSGIARALEWVLTDLPLDRGWNAIDYLRSIMGDGVKEVTGDEGDRGSVAFK